jgi:hypothetical protein
MKKITLFLLFTSFITTAQWNQLGTNINGQATNEQSGSSSKLNADGTVLVVSLLGNGQRNYDR